MEHFLKRVDQAVTTDGEYCGYCKIDIGHRDDRIERTGLCKGDGRVRNDLDEKHPTGSLYELCTACHIREGRDSHHAGSDLDKEEDLGCRYKDRGDEDRSEMQEEGGSRIQEDAR